MSKRRIDFGGTDTDVAIANSDEQAAFALLREMDLPLEPIARFTVDGEPLSKSRPRFARGSDGRTRTYTPRATRDAEDHIGWMFKAAAPGHRSESDSEYGLVVLFFLCSRQRRDVDNLLKTVLDGLTGVAWEDDVQVCELSTRRSFVDREDEARTEVLVYRIGPTDRPQGTCEHCGGEFDWYPSHDGRRFCSRDCWYQHRRDKGSKECPACGEMFWLPEQKDRVYCSPECRRSGHTVTRTCGECGREFQRSKSQDRSGKSYCSQQCHADHARKRRAKNAKGTCEVCGAPNSKKQYRRCLACKLAGRLP